MAKSGGCAFAEKHSDDEEDGDDDEEGSSVDERRSAEQSATETTPVAAVAEQLNWPPPPVVAAAPVMAPSFDKYAPLVEEKPYYDMVPPHPAYAYSHHHTGSYVPHLPHPHLPQYY